MKSQNPPHHQNHATGDHATMQLNQCKKTSSLPLAGPYLKIMQLGKLASWQAGKLQCNSTVLDRITPTAYIMSKCHIIKPSNNLLDVLVHIAVHQFEVSFKFGCISLHWDEGLKMKPKRVSCCSCSSFNWSKSQRNMQTNERTDKQKRSCFHLLNGAFDGVA